MTQLTDTDQAEALRETARVLKRVSAVHDPQELQRVFSSHMPRNNNPDGYISFSRRGLGAGEYKITRRLLDTEAMAENPVNPWEVWDRLPTHSGGWIGEIIKQDEPRMFNDLQLRNDPALGDALAEFHSAIAVPLYDEGEAVNWSIMLRREPNAYSDQEMNDLLLRGNLIGRMTRSLVIRKEVEHLNERLTKQFEEIAKIQMSLLPTHTPHERGLEIATSYLTSNEAGGDYYDFFPFKDGRFGVVIADVSGHGAGAATVMAMLQTMLHNHAHEDATPGELLRLANESLVAKRLDGNFVTAFFGVIDPERRKITYANAGHHPPIRHREDGTIDQLAMARSAPLGVLEGMEFPEDVTELEKMDTLILYTDGITEAFSIGPEREMFGVDGLVESLTTCTGAPACAVDSIHNALFKHTQHLGREDDQTIVVLRITE